MAERTRVLRSGQSMAPGDRLLSRKTAQGRREFRLDYQSDGNLVLYDEGGKPLWATDEWIPGGRVTMDRALSLTVRNAAGRIWPQPPFAHPEGCRLVLHDDGNLVVYTQDDRPVWSPCTGNAIRAATYNRVRAFESVEPQFPIRSPSGVFTLELTAEGVLVLAENGTPTRKARMTRPRRGSVCVMRPDGELVVYGDPRDRRRHQITFRSGTAAAPGAELVLHDEGNAVIYDTSGKPIWDSVTKFILL